MINKTQSQRWIVTISAGLLILAGLLIHVIPVTAGPPAQTGTPIRYGETVSNEITEAEPCQFFWFEGHAGDPITIDLTRTSGSLDGAMALYQRDGDNFNADPVAFNDDRPTGGLDPLINTTLPATDWYTIMACRLEAEQMRITTGTFSLTLTGPDTIAAPTPTPGSSLSNSIFGSSGKPTPQPTTAVLFNNTIGSSATETAPEQAVTLVDGSMIAGQLGAGEAENRYDLPVLAGDQVLFEWRLLSGDLTPLLRVTDPGGVVLAEASTPDAVEHLNLAFRAPAQVVLTLTVRRSGGASDGTTGDYEIRVTVTPGESTAPEETAVPEEPVETTADYLANPCQSGAEAITGLTSSNRLIDVYTAAGDSYYADQLERTTVFRTDDDLNAVFLVQNVSGSLGVAGLFCAPDGSWLDTGEGTFDVGGPYLLGIDWENRSELWVTGNWFAELYVDGQLELTLGFTVE